MALRIRAADLPVTARLELRDRPSSFVAGVQQTVDILVENRGETVWRWGEHGEPEIRLSYRWLRADGSRVDQEGLRTPFPSDVEPGDGIVVQIDGEVAAENHVPRARLDVGQSVAEPPGRGAPQPAGHSPPRRIAIEVSAALGADLLCL